ncbi:mannose-6-phosphate isomerase, class I [Marinactinospora thermotolerans]|uniref:mannose-6-phosphate isomerase, class I n=1 Tax=Marinactinospora thermotolerans TaxID=531310 RepID=UPI003D8CD418
MRRLINQVRPYAWGSQTAIPRLLGTPPDGRPQAELWLGAHPGAPSRLLVDGEEVPFDGVIAQDPKETLGEQVVLRFGERLPFLLKVLAAEAPLSLQAHPDSSRACAGFLAEEAAGIPVDAPHRNYRDPHHKPELVLALEPFEALCGFRDPAETFADLAPCEGRLARLLRGDLETADPNVALRAAMTRLLTLPADGRAELVGELVESLRDPACARPGSAMNARATIELAERYPGDPGAVAALLLNWVELQPGQALFLPAGNVHAYLRGTAVEVMASSDNVLRAGLTSKHVDIQELLDVVDFSVLPIPYVRPVRSQGRLDYLPGVEEFALSVVEPGTGVARLPGEVPRIVLVLEGRAELRPERGGALVLGRGDSVFVPAADGEVEIGGDAHVVAATIGGWATAGPR